MGIRWIVAPAICILVAIGPGFQFGGECGRTAHKDAARSVDEHIVFVAISWKNQEDNGEGGWIQSQLYIYIHPCVDFSKVPLSSSPSLSVHSKSRMTVVILVIIVESSFVIFSSTKYSESLWWWNCTDKIVLFRLRVLEFVGGVSHSDASSSLIIMDLAKDGSAEKERRSDNKEEGHRLISGLQIRTGFLHNS